MIRLRQPPHPILDEVSQVISTRPRTWLFQMFHLFQINPQMKTRTEILTMSRVWFSKLEATGNDFIFIDVRKTGAKTQINKMMRLESRAAIAKHLCRRNESVGADGVVFIERSHEANFKWDFYNSDGSLAEMCGNAARCAVRYAIEHDLAPNNKVTFKTAAGIIFGKKATPNLFEVSFRQPTDPLKMKIRIGTQALVGYFVNSGVPHFVIRKPLKNRINLLRIAPALRNSSKFGARGTNVTFYEITRPGSIETVTFERGVEGFTRSCGTGAVAAAFVYHIEKLTKKSVKVATPGGKLEVVFNSVSQICSLRGPAHLVYEGELRLK